MKNHIYIFRIDYLELSSPIRLSKTISIIPGNYELQESEKVNFDISFQLNKYSYIFIEKEDYVDFNDLVKDLNLIYALFSFLMSNWVDIYPRENYHIIYENRKSTVLEKAIIIPFRRFEFNLQYSRIHQSKNKIRTVIDEMYMSFKESPITHSIYYIIGELLISKRENIALTKVIYAWNAIEHIAFNYWKKTNKEKLYIIREEKFGPLMESLQDILKEYIKNKIDESTDVNISDLETDLYNQDYKQLLKNKLKNGVDNFSPIMYKIIRMIENEGLNLTKQEYELIRDMNRIRNLIYHIGVRREKIRKKIKKEPFDLINEFLYFLEIKIWEFFKFINKYATLENGIIIFKECVNSKKNLEVKNYSEKIGLLKKLENVREKIENHSNEPTEAQIIGEEKKYRTYINFNYKRDSSEDSLIINYLPQEFPSYGNLIKIKINLDGLDLTFNFHGLFNLGTFSEILIEKPIII